MSLLNNSHMHVGQTWRLATVVLVLTVPAETCRLVFDGCCVDAPVREFAAVLSRLRNLKALDLAESSG